LPAGVKAAFSHLPSFHEPFARISAAQHSTSSVSSPAASETQTPEPDLCLPALPPVGPTDYESTPSLTRLSAVKCAPEGTPCRTRRAAPHAPLLVCKVGEDVDNQDNGKRASSQSTSQDGLDCTGSPPSTLKRKLSTLDRPALGEGVFTFDVFGGDDGNDGHCSSRPAKCPARAIPPILQIENEASTTASHATEQDGGDKSQAAWPGPKEIAEGRSGVGQDPGVVARLDLFSSIALKPCMYVACDSTWLVLSLGSV
jgi:hypothetical protein